MTIIKLPPSEKDVGGVPLARTLPNQKKRSIGAWCFLDHAGPTTFAAQSQGMQVGRHPHTNLQTFTWMIEGEILHKDSLGNEQIISANQVNLMTAGTGLDAGISHTEQSAFAQKKTHPTTEDLRINMVQMWIALPTHQKIAPSFDHYPTLPHWQEGHVACVLTTGAYHSATGQSYQAPTKQYSKLLGLDLHFIADDRINLIMEDNMEYGILVVKGDLTFQGQNYIQNDLIYFDHSDAANNHISIQASQGTRLMFLGGEPLNQKILLWWNFVADNQAEIEQSIIDWNNHHPRFGNVDSKLKRLVAPDLPLNFKA